MAKFRRLKSRSKILTGLIVLAAAISLIYATSTNGIVQAEAPRKGEVSVAAASSQDSHDSLVINTPKSLGAKTVRQLYESGAVNHLITALVEPNTLAMKRGTSSDVHIVLSHKSRINTESVTISNLHNGLRNFLPSAIQGLTDEEISDLFTQPQGIAGEILVNESFSESKVVLPANSNHPVSLTISLPNDLPDEIVGKTIEIGVTFDIQSPSATTSQGGLLTIKVIG